MSKFNLLSDLSDKAKGLLSEQLPFIRQLMTEKALGLAKEHGLNFLQDNDKLRPLFETTYQALPLPLRVLVRQETFITFCLSQKDNLLGNLVPPTAKATQNTSVAKVGAKKGASAAGKSQEEAKKKK